MQGELDAYYGRFFAAEGQGQTAEPYLVRAIAAARDPAEKDALASELARTREVDGYVVKAEADYQRLSTGAAGAAARRRATLALARLRLGSAPEEAVRLLKPLIDDNDPASGRWEAYLLSSRAYAMLGRTPEANAALVAAWREAPAAPVPADAIAITAMDMALDKAAANDRSGEVGLIAIGRTNTWFGGADQLPVCGGELRPEDTVTIAIQADAMQRPLYSAVRASRPGIAQLFTVPLAAAEQHIEGPAVYVALRCRTGLDANVRFIGGATRDLWRWLAEKGYYPPLRPIDPTAGDPVTQLKAQIQTLEQSAGTTSPVLTPVLLQLASMQAAQSRFGNIGNFANARAIADRALAILAKADAPIEILEQLRAQNTLAFAQNQNIADVTGPAALQVVDAMASRPQTSPAQVLAAVVSMNRWQLRPAQRLALADRVLSFLDARHVGTGDPLRQAAELRRAGISREIGTVAGTRQRLIASGVPGDLCGTADRAPSIPPAAMTLTSDDYPRDLLRRNIVGYTAVELAVDANGKISGQRMIVSQPPELFDAITEDKLTGVTLLPAYQGDAPTACRGLVQRVHWQYSYEEGLTFPFGGFPFPQE